MVVLSSFPPPTEGIKHQQPATSAQINDRELGKGTLFITESRLSWVSSSSGQGFSLEYPHIALHAVSRDLQAHQHECLYLMVDTVIEGSETVPHDENEEHSDAVMTEIRFVPDDKGMLDAMFIAMNECQSLHPDPQDSFSDDEEEIFEEDEDEGVYHIGGGGGDADVESDRVEQVPSSNGVEDEPMEMDGQFEDADN